MKTVHNVAGKLGLLTLTALACNMSQAQESGPYIGANVGQSRSTIDDARITNGLLSNGLATTSITDENKSTGYKLFGGYQFNPYLSVEGGYFDLGKFGFNANTVPPGTLNGNIRLRGVNVDLLGSLPITDNFSILGRVGLDYAQARDNFSGTGAIAVVDPSPSESKFNPKFGLGLQYAFTESLAMRLEAERYRVNDAVGNRGDVDLYSLGLVYRFGHAAVAPVARVETPEPVVLSAPTPVPQPAPAPPPAPHFEKIMLSATDLFAFDKSELRASQPKLDEIAVALKRNAEVNNVVIAGYTDRIGSDKYNQGLSERRADAVKAYLVAQGVDAGRLRAEGRGKSNPIVECNDRKRPALILCLEPNRRVEVEQITIEQRVGSVNR